MLYNIFYLKNNLVNGCTFSTDSYYDHINLNQSSGIRHTDDSISPIDANKTRQCVSHGSGYRRIVRDTLSKLRRDR